MGGRRLVVALALMGAVAAAPARADDIVLSGTLTWTATVNTTQLDPGHSVLMGLAAGTLIDMGDGGAPGDGLLHGMTATCPILEEIGGAADSVFITAYCRLSDTGGDTIFLQWTCLGTQDISICGGGAWYITGGTGRFAGIFGSGPADAADLQSPDASTATGFVNFEGTYNFTAAP